MAKTPEVSVVAKKVTFTCGCICTLPLDGKSQWQIIPCYEHADTRDEATAEAERQWNVHKSFDAFKRDRAARTEEANRV